MKLISLVSTPPNIENLYLEESVDERTGNYILKPNIGESLVLNNAFGVEGFPRMISFSEYPLFNHLLSNRMHSMLLKIIDDRI